MLRAGPRRRAGRGAGAGGFSPTTVSWRKLDAAKTQLVRLGGPPPAPDPARADDPAVRHRMACLPLDGLGKILEAALRVQPTARILYGHKVVAVSQDAAQAWVDVERTGQAATERLAADYVAGCDGANSVVRRSLFGDGVFPGHTWDEQLVATNVYYDFSPYGYDDSQFFVHPEHWHMGGQDPARRPVPHLVRRGPPPPPPPVGLSPDQLRARLPDKFRAMLPGNPDPDQYDLVNFSPYRVHQRCVDRMRVGGIVLAADAAHLCNPLYVCVCGCVSGHPCHVYVC